MYQCNVQIRNNGVIFESMLLLLNVTNHDIVQNMPYRPPALSISEVKQEEKQEFKIHEIIKHLYMIHTNITLCLIKCSERQTFLLEGDCLFWISHKMYFNKIHKIANTNAFLWQLKSWCVLKNSQPIIWLSTHRTSLKNDPWRSHRVKSSVSFTRVH